MMSGAVMSGLSMSCTASWVMVPGFWCTKVETLSVKGPAVEGGGGVNAASK
jgi:hypothetical protein